MGYRPTAWCQTYEFIYKAPKWVKGTPRNYTKGHPGNMVILWQLPSSLGLFSTAGAEDYWASKFGVVGIHESLRHELKAAKKDGIKTMLVCPNPVDTDMFRGCWISKEIEPFLPHLKPEYCVKQAMKATLTDQPMTCTPLPENTSWLSWRTSSLWKQLCACTGPYQHTSVCNHFLLKENKPQTTLKQKLESKNLFFGWHIISIRSRWSRCFSLIHIDITDTLWILNPCGLFFNQLKKKWSVN